MLGRLAPSAAQRKLSVPLLDFVTAPLPKAPDTYDGITGAPIQMFGNTRYGDCVFAGMANFDAIRAKLEQRETYCTELDVVSAYLTYNHGQDVGANEGEALREAQTHGFKLGPGDLWTLANGSVTIPVKAIEARHSLIALLGAVYLGVELPNSAQSQKVWDVTGSMRGDSAPGTWGGHALLQGRYNAPAGTVGLATWGADQSCTEAWLQAYCDEVHVPLDAAAALSPFVDFEGLLSALRSAQHVKA
jgi:hypothetical protein